MEEIESRLKGLQVDTVIKPYRSGIDDIYTKLQEVQALPITSEARMELALSIWLEGKNYLDSLETARKALVGPIKKHADWIDSEFRRMRERVQPTLNVLDKNIKAYREMVREKNAEIEQQVQEHMDAIRTGEPIPVVDIPTSTPIQKTVILEEGVATFRKYWEIDVININKVPEKYLKPRELDRRAVQADIKNGVRNVEGLCIYQTEKPARKG